MEIDVQEACRQLSEVKLENRNESKSESVSEHVEKTPSSDIDEEEVNRIQIKYNRLVSKAKQLTGEGQIRAALELNQRALKLHHNEKLAKRIAKMEAYLKEHGDESSDEDSGMVHVGKGFYLYKDFFDKLYAHQREGVSWLWGLYRQKKGGILGDDMGLGKTIQIIAFLSGLFDMQKVHAALLVMPVSVMVNWEKEFKKWAPGIRVNLYHGNSKREKERSLAKIQRRGGVCITSYGLVVTSWKLLSEQDGREFRWDYLILDEGHKIKNPTKTTKGVQAIGARNRLILTGTPVQNNLKELWALFDFVHQGTLLGTARTFKMEFENPITRARERDATAGERRLGMEMAEGLKNIIAPYFLRRTKAEVKEKEARQGTDEKDSAVKMPSMTRKNDLIVWLFLTPTQQQIYEDFLSLDSVKELLMTTKSPLVALTVLKKICDHPRLLSTRACAQLGLDGEDGMDESELDTPEAHQCAANQINQIEDEVLIKESGKLIVLVELLDNLKMEGHRCLVFSQSRKILDIIAKIVKNRGHKVMRLDGTITSIEERDQRIKKFQSDDSYSVFLLTTQVGGVGLTLTAADRVIIFDPSWNPATDEQAVDRVFRIGQDKNVVIYRLITCGTVEEKIYRRQIFKDSITRQTTGSTKNPYRYFTKQELRELFTLDSPRCSTTQQQLEEMHSSNRKTDQSLDAHIAFLYSLDIFGISDHDLMFTQDHSDQNRDDEMDDDTSELEGNDYIQHRVQKARELIQMESSVSTTFNLQEQVKAPRIGEPRQQNWAGPQVNFPKTEEPEFKEEPTEDQGDLSTSCVDLTSPDNSIHDSSPTASEQASNNSVISVSESPSKDENSKSDLNSVKIEALTPDVTRIKSEIESPENKNNSLHEDGKETVSPSLNPQIKKEIDSPKVLDKGDMETRLPVLSLVKKELESPSAVTHQSPKLLDNQSPQVSNRLSPKMLDYQSFEENKENMSPVLYRAKQLNSQSVRNQKESGETNEFQTPSRREKRKSVSKSPWLARTPKLENKKVIEEEIFISPDATRPLVKTEPKLNFKSPLAVKNFSRLNSTLMSAFSSDSPDVCDKSVSSAGSSVSDSPPQSKLGMTFVGESPESKQDPLYTTFVGDSPNMVNKLRDKSRIGNLSNVLKVVDSTQNTPISLSAQSSIHGEKSANMEEVCVVESTDDESSPQKSFTDSPIHTVKNRHKVRKAVIESSDEEYGIKSDDESPSVDAIKNSDSESEDKCGHSNKFSDKENEKSVSESDKQEVCESDNETEEDKNDIHVNKKKKSVIASSDSDMDTDGAPKNVRRSDFKNHLESDQSGDEDSVCSENSFIDDHKNKLNKKKEKSLSKNPFINAEVESDNENVSKSQASDDEEEEDDDSDLSGFVVDDDEEITEEEDNSESASVNDDESLEEEDSENEDKEKDDIENLPEDMKKQFKELTEVGRSLYRSGQYEEAMAYILQALEIYPDTSLQVLALKLNKKISE